MLRLAGHLRCQDFYTCPEFSSRRSVDTARSTFAGRALTSHFGWHNRREDRSDLAQRAGGGRPILTAGPCVSLPGNGVTQGTLRLGGLRRSLAGSRWAAPTMADNGPQGSYHHFAAVYVALMAQWPPPWDTPWVKLLRPAKAGGCNGHNRRARRQPG